MSSVFIHIFIISIFLSIISTLLIRQLALRLRIIDWPEIGGRKIHLQPVPLLGGLAIFLTFFIILFLIYFSPFWPVKKFSFFEVLPKNLNLVTIKQIVGLLLASIFLMIGGFLDDKYHLKPKQQIVWSILAALVVIISGIGIRYINNPFGLGYLYFDKWKFEIFRFQGVPFHFTPLADLFTFVWLMILMYSTKLLDGLDGLVSGISVIGGLIIAGLCLVTRFYQPDVAILAIIFAGASLGFLFFNFHPAKIFLGEGGSLFAGFMLGSLAIISGGKIATAFLVLGLAILDIFFVIIRRIFIEHKSPFSAGREHLHFKLLDIGFSHCSAVIFLWLVALIFGGLALFLRTQGKIIILGILIILMIFLVIYITFKERQISKNKIYSLRSSTGSLRENQK
ncbi:MAG: MraY family glycosyltransferase [Patescibacteria group bacterium]